MPERFYSRRSFLKGSSLIPSSIALSMVIGERNFSPEPDLSDYKAKTIAHNAANIPERFLRALTSNIRTIEVDLSVVNNKAIVSHSLDDYLSLTPSSVLMQEPGIILEQINNYEKSVMFDLKNSVENTDLVKDFVNQDSQNNLVSSNNHRLLDDLRDQGFEGTILYSIGNEASLYDFLSKNSKKKFIDGYGVSIRHNLFRGVVPSMLRDMGLKTAVWNPKSAEDIASSLKKGADIVTSDNFRLLEKIKKPDL